MIAASSSLAFRSLLKSAAARSGLTRAPGRLTGLSPSAAGFHLAALGARIVAVVPTDADVERLTSDTRFFLGAMEGLSTVDLESAVVSFPSQEVDPYRGLTPHLEVAAARARALHLLTTGAARVVITSARALLPRLSAPARLAAAGITLRTGMEIAPQDLGERLALAGFSPGDPVDEHGEFCVRGGVVDFFAAFEAQPIRLEFIGDIIESIRRYDAATQRSQRALDQAAITPLRELLGAEGGADDPAAFDRSSSIVDYARLAGASLVVVEPDDVNERGNALEKQWRASAVDMEARGRTVPPYEHIAIAWKDVRAWLASGRELSQLAIGDGDGPEAQHVNCLPSVEYHGRIADWMSEVRAARAREETTVFLAATPGRAERTIELAADYDIRARDIATADDLA
ncbi:MAG TPA: hypothetical protein VLT86_13015, partial [Vicinamibacterales bacterium]|nr:hypothetical protein [Vicinamibacterales bacterium]